MSIKLLYAPDGRVLGAQIVGYDGVDKRIDVLASAVRFGKTVYDLEELELAYAPPYSSAKDPVNMAGYVAVNQLKGDVEVIHWDRLSGAEREKYFVLDVRLPKEAKEGYIEGSVNIPLDELRSRIDELPRDRGIIVYCKVGLRAYIAYRILVQRGFQNVKNLSGGYRLYAAVKASEKALKGKTEKPREVSCI